MTLARRTLAAVLLLCGVAEPARAQLRGSGDGYLFGEPRTRLSLRAGYAQARAGSDLFDELTNTFILSRSDFGGIAVGGELGVQLTPRVELSGSVDYSGRRTDSEYRHLVDQDGRPIEQTTRFERVPVMGNVRVAILPRGRSVGRLAWVPARVVPWVGGGAGAVWYRLRQLGDFVDQTSAVDFDELSSEGWALGAHAMGGLDVSLTSRVMLTTDVRSTWARAPLGRDYVGYERLDLSGVSATLGLTFRL